MNKLLFSLLLLSGCSSILPPVTNPDYAAKRYQEALKAVTTGQGLVCSTTEGFFWVKYGGFVKEYANESEPKYFEVVDTHGHKHYVLSTIAIPNCSIEK
jgi:hypothetical protein